MCMARSVRSPDNEPHAVSLAPPIDGHIRVLALMGAVLVLAGLRPAAPGTSVDLVIVAGRGKPAEHGAPCRGVRPDKDRRTERELVPGIRVLGRSPCSMPCGGRPSLLDCPTGDCLKIIPFRSLFVLADVGVSSVWRLHVCLAPLSGSVEIAGLSTLLRASGPAFDEFACLMMPSPWSQTRRWHFASSSCSPYRRHSVVPRAEGLSSRRLLWSDINYGRCLMWHRRCWVGGRALVHHRIGPFAHRGAVALAVAATVFVIVTWMGHLPAFR